MIKFLTKIISASIPSQSQQDSYKYFGSNEQKKGKLQCILCNEKFNVSSNIKHNCNIRKF